MHESIGGGGGQISVSTSAATRSSSSSRSSSSKVHRVDDTPIEHTSFGGPAQNNNDTVKSRAEQVVAHRRVRIQLFLNYWSETQHLGVAALFAARFIFLCIALRCIAVAPDCGFFFKAASWWFANRSFERHGRRGSSGSSKGMFMLCSREAPCKSPLSLSFFPFLFLFSYLFSFYCSTRSATNISDGCWRIRGRPFPPTRSPA